MNTSELAIAVRNLSKEYIIAHEQKFTTLGERVITRLKNPFHRTPKERFLALKDVSFEINKGDIVGVIGWNGSGKSTLLRILSNITHPTRGEIDLYGRVGSLLEVGTGFHPELTGRENIFLNGAILGMTRAEIRRQFDAIVDFAEVEKFLDTPVKRYSSGMYVRLAFAVAAHLNPEILIVDEVLAVGDADFQNKCIGKMQDVAKDGSRTVLFVSHNVAAVETLCTRAILLDAGTVIHNGDVPTATKQYLQRNISANMPRQIIHGKGFELHGFKVVNPRRGVLRTFDPCDIHVDFRTPTPCSAAVHLFIEDSRGAVVMGLDSSDLVANPRTDSNTMYSYHFQIRSLPLITGNYRLRAILRNDTGCWIWEVPIILNLVIESVEVYGSRQLVQRWHGTTAAPTQVTLTAAPYKEEPEQIKTLTASTEAA